MLKFIAYKYYYAQSKIDPKLWLLVAAVFCIFWGYNVFFKEKKEQVSIDGYLLSIEPCISATNEFLQGSVDAKKTCTCLYPKYYETIKNDSVKRADFIQNGFASEINGSKELMFVYQDCILQNIIDTTYRVYFNDSLQNVFTPKVRQMLSAVPGIENFNIDSLSVCFFNLLNGRLTVREYFSDDYSAIPGMDSLIENCVRNYQ